MKKAAAFLLALLLLLSACSNAGPSSADAPTADAGSAGQLSSGSDGADVPAETDGPAYTLPELDYEGRSFGMIVGDGYSVDSLADEQTGEALNDAKFSMARTVEDAFNVTVGETPTDFWGMSAEVQRLVQSGDETYNAVAMMDRFAVQTTTAGCFLSLASVESLNLSEPYWGGPLAKELTIGGKAYFGISSMNLASYGKVACTFINRNLAANLGIEVPFDDVFEGKWTKDKLLSYAGIAESDLNGDGVMDASDRYTYAPGDIRGVPYQFLIGWQERVIRKDEEDIPTLTIYDSEVYLDLLSVVHGMMFGGSNDLTGFMNRNTGMLSAGSMFLNGNVLFLISVFSNMDGLREMENDFSILPMSKLDETQERYISRTYDSTFHMIPVTEKDPEFSGTLLDALSCVGYHDMIPVYLDTVLKAKLSRDELSRECIQICFDGRTLEFAEAYLADSFMDERMFDLMLGGPGTFASTLKKNGKINVKTLEKLVKSLTKNG